MSKINDNHDPHHHGHDHPNLVEGDRLQFTSEGKGGVAPLFIQILDALDENADGDDKDDDDDAWYSRLPRSICKWELSEPPPRSGIRLVCTRAALLTFFPF